MSLPGLKFLALTHHAAHWPLPGKVLLGCALAGVVWVVGDLVHLSPLRERLHQTEVRETELQQHIAQKTALAVSVDARNRQLQSDQEQADKLLRQLQGESEMPGLLEDIARLALANGLLIESVTPLPEQSRAFYTEQPVQIGVTGIYHDLATFVSDLGGLSRITTTHEINLRPDGRLLRLDLLASTYWRARPGGASAEPFVQTPRFAYDSSGLRDPFQPLALQFDHTPGRPGAAPNLARPRGALENLTVDQFEMVGTLSRGLQTFALLRAASEVHRLAVGDYLGPDHGRVTAIHDNRVNSSSCSPINRAHGWSAREPSC